MTTCRLVELKAHIALGVDPCDVIRRLSQRIAKIPNVVADAATSIEVSEQRDMGSVIAVRLPCLNQHYEQVHADARRAVSIVCDEVNYADAGKCRVLRQSAT